MNIMMSQTGTAWNVTADTCFVPAVPKVRFDRESRRGVSDEKPDPL